MSSVIRDFSIDTTEKIKSMIRENVDEESQFGLFDWFEDTFVTKELDIGDYLDDVTEYQKKMIDKHNISGKKFDKIIERVYAVDTNYASRMVLLNERMEAFQTHIYQIMQMQKPEALLLDSDTYQNTTENIKLIYSKAVNGKYNSGISELEHELPALRDVAWYEKAYNVVVGFTEGTIVNTLEGVLYLPLSAIDAIAHTHSIDGLENTEDQINQYFIDNFVTDEESYYIGKITADVTDTAIGIIMGIAGIQSIIGSVTLLTTGAAVSSTGVGIAVGASGMALSIPLALAGAGELILGGSLVYCSMSNLDEDSNSASSAKKPEIDAEKQNAEVEKIKNTIEKTSEGGNGSTKPNQVHHYATNKSKTYTPQLEEITKKYGLDLDDAWNKDLLPHQGRHPNAYHNYVLDSMKQFDDIAQGDKDVFLKLYENLKSNVKANPDMLYKDYWN